MEIVNILGILSLIFTLVFIFKLTLFSFEIRFLSFKLEKHPRISERIKNTLLNICEVEGIAVFNKTYKEINPDIAENDNNGAVGRYIHLKCNDSKIKIKNILSDIEDLEKKHGKTYEELCEFHNIKDYSTKEDFIFPRIKLAYDVLEKGFGLLQYYRTFTHELGHHFAAMEIGEHNEDDANNYGNMLIMEHFPDYYKLFFNCGLYSIDDIPLKEKIKLIFKYFWFEKFKLK